MINRTQNVIISTAKIVMSTKIYSMISNKKFHQMLNLVDFDQHIHKIPQDNILSKFIQQDKPKFTENQQYKILNNRANKNHLKLSSNPTKKVDYKHLLSTNPHGSILTQTHKSAQICLSGMNYTNVSYDNIYKSILKFEPDCILVQQRPENFCEKFQVIKKSPETQVFSDRLYVEQLELSRVFDVKRELSEQDVKSLEGQLFPRKGRQYGRNTQKDEYFPFLTRQLISQKPLLTSIYHSLKNQTPIFLCQLPQQVQRQWLCNTHTLMQLQELFKITAKSLPLYPGIRNLTPFQLASYLFPDQVLAINDKYMATLVEVMLALGYKKVMMFGGVAQNQAVMEILKNEYHCDEEGNINPLIRYLVPQKVKGSIIRDYDTLQLIEKHILVDTLYHGRDVKNVKVSDFHTTNKIIRHYASKQPKELIFQFRYEMCMKYSEMLEECVAEGEARKKKEFMREAIRM